VEVPQQLLASKTCFFEHPVFNVQPRGSTSLRMYDFSGICSFSFERDGHSSSINAGATTLEVFGKGVSISFFFVTKRKRALAAVLRRALRLAFKLAGVRPGQLRVELTPNRADARQSRAWVWCNLLARLHKCPVLYKQCLWCAFDVPLLCLWYGAARAGLRLVSFFRVPPVCCEVRCVGRRAHHGR
jgi:hypothetical protein